MQSATYTAPIGHVPGVDDSASGNEDGSVPPANTGSASTGKAPRPSPRTAKAPQQSQPPPSPSVLNSPNAPMVTQSLPPSPHIRQSPSERGGPRYGAHFAGAGPSYEGYGGLGLAPSAYASPQQPDRRSRSNYSSGPSNQQGEYQDESSSNTGSMGPPPTLSHSRSWSEGPRRSNSSGAYPMSGGQYAFGSEYYAQDLAGVATSSGWGHSAHVSGTYDGPPIGTMLRRSSSLEGLRAAHNEYTNNTPSYER